MLLCQTFMIKSVEGQILCDFVLCKVVKTTLSSFCDIIKYYDENVINNAQVSVVYLLRNTILFKDGWCSATSRCSATLYLTLRQRWCSGERCYVQCSSLCAASSWTSVTVSETGCLLRRESWCLRTSLSKSLYHLIQFWFLSCFQPMVIL